ncbi:MAG: potassium transporter Trk [Candidatus Pelagibacter sp.]|nr:potassium transporter Trk [Candidatus Pelagibacter sp.]
MKIKSCLYFLGLSCFPISLMSLINIFYSFYFDYLLNIKSYLLVLLLSSILGLFLFKIGKKESSNINFFDQLFLILLIYLLMSIFISIPFYQSSYDVNFIDAFFESISGITGTGFSIFNDIRILDEPLILWRSSSQWLGGFYFLIFLVLIFSNKQINFKMVDFSFNLEKKIYLSSNLLSVTGRIFFIYFLLTIFIFLLFLISDVRLFDSLNLTMTVISSGGFLPTNSLGEIIRNNFQSVLLSFTFLLSILNFYIFYNIFLRRDNIKHHSEDLYLIILILFFSIIFYLISGENLTTVSINVLSSIGNSGISISQIPDNFGLLFILLTLVGGSVLSTTSGLKFIRIYILVKAFFMEMYSLFKPNFVLNNKLIFSEKKINTDNIKISFLIFILFFLSLFVLSSILLLDTLNFENSFKLSILTLTNTNVSNIYGMEKIMFLELFTFTKISLIIFMVIAKVELLAIFIIIRKVFFKN